MKIEIHPLQESCVALLRALYADMRLPPTPAMVAVGNNQYPSLEQILSTLETYKDVDLVIAFVQDNASAIDDAKRKLTQDKAASAKPTEPFENLDIGAAHRALNESKEAWAEVAKRPLKNVTVDQIEQAFAKALLELTDQTYQVNLQRIDLHPEANAWFRDTTSLDFRVEKS